MATSLPTLILIHGGWHVPKTYSKFIDSLRAAGFEVHVPRLPSVNEARPPNADLYTDTQLIRGYVESLVEVGRTVIAIMHSYGGQVGTNALHGLGVDSRRSGGRSGGVSHLIYMCAFALPEGKSMVSKVQKFGHEHLLPLTFNFAEDDSCVNRDPRTLLVGSSGLDDAEVETYVATLVRWNGRSMYQAISRCAWREIPVTYVYTMRDVTVPVEYQKSMVEYMRAEGRLVRTIELDTGHCPNLTMTEEVVNVVMEVAAGQGSWLDNEYVPLMEEAWAEAKAAPGDQIEGCQV